MHVKQKPNRNLIKLLILFLSITIPWVIAVFIIEEVNEMKLEMDGPAVNYSVDSTKRVDHSKFVSLQQEFNTPQEVTDACLTCHNMTAQEVMKSSHWTWTRDYKMEDGSIIKLGKKNIINNFCIGIASNETRCTSCHIGYGWEDENFDFTDSRNIDCIVCHDKTGTYKKFPTGAGYPVTEEKQFGGKTYLPPDYNVIAQNVGTPGAENCGACHFVGGGGNNVKHGDIASELVGITRDVDVHLGKDGANLSCIDCHKTTDHNISGNLYSIASIDDNRVTCNQCHTDQPHKSRNLNKHVSRIACQTCHIPEYAKLSSTKMTWGWSTAGKTKEDGSFIVEYDSLGNITYHSQKGSFKWANNVVPEYTWFNGNASHYILGEQVDTTGPVQINTLHGDYHDKESILVPVKVHRGKQIYDPVNNTMIQAHLFGNHSAAFWKGFDWDIAAEVGMKTIGLPYSGEYSFVSTEMSWPLNHMVAPADQSLKCADCHSRDGRLYDVAGFYLAGRDRSPFLDKIGFLLIIFAVAGVGIHAAIRIFKK